MAGGGVRGRELSRRDFSAAATLGRGRAGARRAAGGRATARAPTRRPRPCRVDGAILQAFADTIVPGRKAAAHRPRRRDPPAGDRRRRPRARRRRGRRAAALPAPAARLRRAGARRSWPTSRRARSPQGGLVPRPRLRRARGGGAWRASTSATRPRALGGGGRGPVHRLLRRRRPSATRPAATASGCRVMGHPGAAPNGYRELLLPPQARPRAHARRATSADGRARGRLHRGLGLRRLDRRLAAGRALPRRGADPARILVLERGRRFKHTDFRQSMDVDHLSDVYNLIQSTGGTARRSSTANARRRRARTSTWPRRCARRARPSSAATAAPTTAPTGACGPRAISRSDARTATTRAPSAALRVRQPDVERGVEVRRAVGGHARRRRATPATACRWRSTSAAAWTPSGATPAASSARRTRVNTNYLASAERAGVRVRPNRQVERVRRARPNASGYRYVVTASVMDNEGPDPTRQPAGQRGDRVQGADPGRGRDGHAADPDALAHRPARRCPSRSAATSA